ncbi:MAG: hypothetical protein JO023_22520 [Chloroflexi bacterium]|nr:hypothetical protein [Chloroflexota bacterium]
MVRASNLARRLTEHAHRWLAESQSIFAELGGSHDLMWVLQIQQFLLASAGHLEPALRVLAAFHGLIGLIGEPLPLT